MNWSTGLSWLAGLKAAPAEQRSDEPDPADMGTAFGLDASFGPVGDAPLPGFGRGASEAPPPWEHRLTRRSSL